MKATDLMIGDWVLVKDAPSAEFRPCRVTIGLLRNLLISNETKRSVKPIPLTKEILEKNGFYKSEVGKRDEIGNYFLEKYDAPILFFSIHYDDGRDIGNRIEYVHELQHALKLCGIEKEIVL